MHFTNIEYCNKCPAQLHTDYKTLHVILQSLDKFFHIFNFRLSYERTYHHQTLNSVYDTIQDVYEEPIKSFQDGSEGEKNFHD